MPSFLVNYGGPAPQFSSNSHSFSETLKACEKFYQSQAKSTAFTVHGLDVTYYQVGIHRMVKVDLPDQVLEEMKSNDSATRKKAIETKKLFDKAKSQASDFNTKDYKLLGNNCVSAVANVLNTIDPSILGGVHKIVPQVLDGNVDEALKLDAEVDSILRGTTLPQQQGKQHKDYTHAHVASEIWAQVMTPVSQQHQKDLKQQLQKSKQESIELTPEDDTTKKSAMR
ncbi:Uncharacterised protein [Legionella steigerwaltii]|uniref:Uncharacterized protein n=1 Tax=Legionella steigerwaltii TaxID=460 RepID=A0A378LBI8_9GAMM|nr:DUF778 domain-containing protein [Legionella steigerwaltii]KTD78200.1 hypothetical protein Lstg_1481 [Legionella steigerwaltii]STY24395.1 Uncharacterised protein [Legionella steigerwaltii]